MLSILVHGLQATLAVVIVIVAPGSPTFTIAGVGAAVRESRVRVRAALHACGLDLDGHSIALSVEPAAEGRTAGLDLAMAVAVVRSLAGLPPVDGVVFIGELSLTGTVRPTRGVLTALRGAVAAGIRVAIVPPENAAEGVLVPGIEVFVAGHLRDVLAHLDGTATLDHAPAAGPYEPTFGQGPIDLADLRGQHSAVRALELAAAGGHNLVLVTARRFCGTALARRLPTILPGMTRGDALDVTEVHSAAGMLHPEGGIVTTRPFRAPHHTVSAAGLAGKVSAPGEVALAHNGVLFLDELDQFKAVAVSVLTRAMDDVAAPYPTGAQVVATVSPCFCGDTGTEVPCSCTPERTVRHRAMVAERTRPFRPIRVALTAPGGAAAESSAVVRARVVAARAMQAERARAFHCAPTNGSLTAHEAARVVRLSDDLKATLATEAAKFGLTTEEQANVLRVARTSADLDGREEVGLPHLVEAFYLLASW